MTIYFAESVLLELVRRQVSNYSLLVACLLERRAPMRLEAVAQRFEALGYAKAERALTSLKRCRPGRPPVYKRADGTYEVDVFDVRLDNAFSNLPVESVTAISDVAILVVDDVKTPRRFVLLDDDVLETTDAEVLLNRLVKCKRIAGEHIRDVLLALDFEVEDDVCLDEMFLKKKGTKSGYENYTHYLLNEHLAAFETPLSEAQEELARATPHEVRVMSLLHDHAIHLSVLHRMGVLHGDRLLELVDELQGEQTIRWQREGDVSFDALANQAAQQERVLKIVDNVGVSGLDALDYYRECVVIRDPLTKDRVHVFDVHNYEAILPVFILDARVSRELNPEELEFGRRLREQVRARRNEVSPLQRDHQALFDRLVSDEELATPMQLHGILTGLMLTQRTVMPSDWLPLVLQDYVPRDLDDVNSLMVAVMDVYNDVLGYLEAGTPVHPMGWPLRMAEQHFCFGLMSVVALEPSLRFAKPLEGLWIMVQKLAEQRFDSDDVEPLPVSDRLLLSAELPEAVVEAFVAMKALRVPTVRREGKKVGRNERCPCGSGKKFKRCCGVVH